MNIVRVPKKGEARLPLPGPDVRVLTGKDPDAGRSGAGPIRGGIRRAGPQDWFWQRHDPHRRAASPARWQAALAALTDRHRSAKPIVSQKLIASIVDRYGRLIDDAAERHGISPALVAAVIAVESAGREKAVSHAGAGGLMQLMPATARRFGVTDRYAAQQNVQGGSAYLDWLLDNFGQDPILALAGYNAGEGAVQRHAGVPPYRETRDYVVKVFDALVAAMPLCATPPASPRAPCDWRVRTN